MRPSRVAVIAIAVAIIVALAIAFAAERTTDRSHHRWRLPASLPVPRQEASSPLSSDDSTTVATPGPVPIAEAFALAEWTSDGTGGLQALAARTARWTSARLRSQWSTAPDPPTPPGPAARANLLDAFVVDPRRAPVVVQVDVERFWSEGTSLVADSVPHILLLTMAYEAGAWTVDDVAAVS